MDGLKTRLREVLAAYGADPARWPAAERDRLKALAQQEPELMAEALEIDRVLARATQPPVPQGAAQRLMARIGQEPKGRIVPVRTRPEKSYPSIWAWGAGAALAASFAFGLFLGTTNFVSRFLDADVVEIDDPIVLTGIDDAPALLEGGDG